MALKTVFITLSIPAPVVLESGGAASDDGGGIDRPDYPVKAREGALLTSPPTPWAHVWARQRERTRQHRADGL